MVDLPVAEPEQVLRGLATAATWSASATTSLVDTPYGPDRLSTGRSPIAPAPSENAPTGSLTTMPSTPWSTSSRSAS